MLVNNAGVGPRADLVEMTTEQWDRVIGRQPARTVPVTRAVCPRLMRRLGAIVTMSSISAVGDAARVDYAAAKAGLIGFTKSLARQLGRHGITANAIAPGFVVSDMTRASAERLGLTSPSSSADRGGVHPGRPGRPARGRRAHRVVPRRPKRGSSPARSSTWPGGRWTEPARTVVAGQVVTTSLPVAVPAAMTRCAATISSKSNTRPMGTVASPAATASRKPCSTAAGRSEGIPAVGAEPYPLGQVSR